jgi:hypothetical protein
MRKLRIDHAFIPIAVIVLVITALLNLSVFTVSALSCVGMVACDMAGVLLTVSEARGQDTLAGYGDMGSDFMGKFILAGWSGSTLTHGHGILGWVAILPILVTGFYTTKHMTRWSRKMKTYNEVGCEVTAPTGNMGEQ